MKTLVLALAIVVASSDSLIGQLVITSANRAVDATSYDCANDNSCDKASTKQIGDFNELVFSSEDSDENCDGSVSALASQQSYVGTKFFSGFLLAESAFDFGKGYGFGQSSIVVEFSNASPYHYDLAGEYSVFGANSCQSCTRLTLSGGNISHTVESNEFSEGKFGFDGILPEGKYVLTASTTAYTDIFTSDSIQATLTFDLEFTQPGNFVLGDVNQDGAVNLLDVQPFVEVLVLGNFQDEADINQDESVDLLDVPLFVELLSE